MGDLLIEHQISLLIFLGVLLLIALSNLRALRRLGTYSLPAYFPRVSILVPVRNEEVHVEPCVRSLLAQDYPDFEVVVLDDGSTDETGHILAALAAENNRLRVLQGQPLPAGWLGKHWACHQLAQAASGELLLFTDADTRHTPHALRDGVAALLAEGADLLTAIPRQEVATWAERLAVPIFPWSIFSFLPLIVAHHWRWPAFSATVGQYMLFRRPAYARVGGHAAVRRDVVDDIALGRRVKAEGLRWRLVGAGGHVHCRMYDGFRQVYEGFSKNLFAAFGNNLLLFVFVWSWLGIVFLEPLVILVLGAVGFRLPGVSLALAAAAVGLAVLLWGLSHWRFGFPLYLAFFYPAAIILGIVIATRSLLLTLTGRATWKGRRIGGGRWSNPT